MILDPFSAEIVSFCRDDDDDDDVGVRKKQTEALQMAVRYSSMVRLLTGFSFSTLFLKISSKTKRTLAPPML